MTGPRLIATRSPRSPEGVVIVLHGGGGRRGNMMVKPTQLSVLRMIPIAWRIALRGRGRLAVVRLLNSTRGWSTQHTPVDDVRWAISRVQETFGAEQPIALVGHSLGGRAALLAASMPGVTTTVCLNPYLQPQDGRADLGDAEVMIIHGTEDRIAPLRIVEAVTQQLRRSASVTLVRVIGGKHAMLARYGQFDGLATQFVLSRLLGTPSSVLSGETGTSQTLEV